VVCIGSRTSFSSGEVLDASNELRLNFLAPARAGGAHNGQSQNTRPFGLQTGCSHEYKRETRSQRPEQEHPIIPISPDKAAYWKEWHIKSHNSVMANKRESKHPVHPGFIRSLCAHVIPLLEVADAGSDEAPRAVSACGSPENVYVPADSDGHDVR